MELLNGGDYADLQIKDEKEEKAISYATAKKLCDKCGSLEVNDRHRYIFGVRMCVKCLEIYSDCENGQVLCFSCDSWVKVKQSEAVGKLSLCADCYIEKESEGFGLIG